MYNATQDLILTVKKKMISIVPQFKSNFIWPDTRGIKVHYLLQFMVMALMFGIAFSRILQKKKTISRLIFIHSKYFSISDWPAWFSWQSVGLVSGKP